MKPRIKVTKCISFSIHILYSYICENPTIEDRTKQIREGRRKGRQSIVLDKLIEVNSRGNCKLLVMLTSQYRNQSIS